jgi:hypothetical protein
MACSFVKEALLELPMELEKTHRKRRINVQQLARLVTGLGR